MCSLLRLLIISTLMTLVLSSCAKKEPEVQFRPLQLHWHVASGQSDKTMPNKDECVIKITGRLMGESLVQSSTVGELVYSVTYGHSEKFPKILEFKGFCEDSAIEKLLECSWVATCDEESKVVVKFNNGV